MVMMKKIKILVKNIIGLVRCLLYGIHQNGRVCIGKNVNIKGGKHIILDKNVCIRSNVDIWAGPGAIYIGSGSDIGQRSRISITNKLTIGKDVLLSPNVYITDCDHEYRNIDVAIINQGICQNNNSVYIGDGSYIGINTVIVGNVNIGKHCVIGANSVVTKDVPDYSLAVGIPAKPIKKYNFTTEKWMPINGDE